jgi:hypothetical protein
MILEWSVVAALVGGICTVAGFAYGHAHRVVRMFRYEMDARLAAIHQVLAEIREDIRELRKMREREAQRR